MKEAEYIRLRRKFEKEHQERIRALEVIYRSTNDGQEPPPLEDERWGKLTRAVRAAIFTFGEATFGLKEVRDALQNSGTPNRQSSVSTILARLVDDGFIHQVSRGTGRFSSTYQRVGEVNS